jgi:pyrimidine-nucleoside phosphorylase
VNPTELIRKKRNGGVLTEEELQFLIDGYLNGKIPEYQMSAFLMAVYFQKMNFEETTQFTGIMLRSGVVVDLSGIPGVKVDKHSTGGVGDKVSLILAPMVAACGVPVPMISGRGLGHTGGTLDKLESIPGFNTQLSIAEYKSVLAEVGTVMIGQTKEIAPADKRMYALRDVTGTVESIPLIAGSIMSKKLAEGIDALVLDIKTGKGAFMQSDEQAIELAKTLIAIGTKFNKKTIGFITDMNQPLGNAVGNWLETLECIECMKGRNVPDLMEVTYVLGGAMVMLGGKASSVKDGMRLCSEAIQSGKALSVFRKMVEKQNGELKYIDKPELYPSSKYVHEIISTAAGYVEFIDALEIGFAGIMVGAGRTRVDEEIDYKAGILLNKKVGDTVKAEEVLATIYTDRSNIIDEAIRRTTMAFRIGSSAPQKPPLIKSMIDMNGTHTWGNNG